MIQTHRVLWLTQSNDAILKKKKITHLLSTAQRFLNLMILLDAAQQQQKWSQNEIVFDKKEKKIKKERDCWRKMKK